MKSRIYSFLAGNSEHKKRKGINRNVVAITRYNEYKDILNNECIRHLMNKIKVKTIEWQHINSAKFHCLVSITKFIFETLDRMD